MKSADRQGMKLPYLHSSANHKHSNQRSLSRNKLEGKRSFVVRQTDSQLPFYQPLTDKHLESFLQKNRVKKHLQKLGLLKNGEESRMQKQLQAETKRKQLHVSTEDKRMPTEKQRAHTVNVRKYITKVEFDDYMESMRKKIDVQSSTAMNSQDRP